MLLRLKWPIDASMSFQPATRLRCRVRSSSLDSRLAPWMKVVLHPAAEQEVLEAAAFYEREGSPVLAARFVAESKRLATLLLDHPVRTVENFVVAVPESIDVSQYKAVIIWCESFSQFITLAQYQ